MNENTWKNIERKKTPLVNGGKHRNWKKWSRSWTLKHTTFRADTKEVKAFYETLKILKNRISMCKRHSILEKTAICDQAAVDPRSRDTNLDFFFVKIAKSRFSTDDNLNCKRCQTFLTPLIKWYQPWKNAK